MNKKLTVFVAIFTILAHACASVSTTRNCKQSEHNIVSNQYIRLLWSKSNIYVLPSKFNPMIQGITSSIFVGVQDSNDGSSKVIAFDTKVGDLLWQQNVDLSVTLLADSENLYVGNYNRIIIYDPQTGRLRKEIKLPKVGVVQNMYSTEQNLYIRTGNGTWVTYDTTDGTTDISESLLPYTPFIIEGAILYLHDAEGFKAMQTDTQTTLWKYPINEVINVHPLFTNGLMIISTQPGDIYALNKDTGELAWRLDTHVISNIAADSSRLYFLTREGYFVAADNSSGEQVQKLEFSPASFDLSTSNQIVGGYNVWVDSQDKIAVISLGDSCQLMAFKLEIP